MKILTFPIGTRSEIVKFGLTIVPAIANLISINKGVPYTLALNTLDSYIANRENFVRPYLLELKNQGIDYGNIWIDSNKKEHGELLAVIDKLITIGFISQQVRKVYRCKCGKVELLDCAIMNKKARLYSVETDGAIKCKACSCLVKSKKTKCLIGKFSNVDLPFKIVPENKRREVLDTISRMTEMEFLVSRSRNTGIQCDIDGELYNIDVDFFWLNLLNTFDDSEYIVCGSNHVLWHLSMMHALKKVLDPSAETSIILSPYIYNLEFEVEKFIDIHSPQAYLAFLGNLSWKKGSTSWNLEFIKKLKTVNSKEVSYILKYISDNILGDDISNLSKVNRNLIMRIRKEYRNESKI